MTSRHEIGPHAGSTYVVIRFCKFELMMRMQIPCTMGTRYMIPKVKPSCISCTWLVDITNTPNSHSTIGTCPQFPRDRISIYSPSKL